MIRDINIFGQKFFKERAEEEWLETLKESPVEDLSDEERIAVKFIMGHLKRITEGKEALTYEKAAPKTAGELYLGAKVIAENPSDYNLSAEQEEFIENIIRSAEAKKAA